MKKAIALIKKLKYLIRKKFPSWEYFRKCLLYKISSYGSIQLFNIIVFYYDDINLKSMRNYNNIKHNSKKNL